MSEERPWNLPITEQQWAQLLPWMREQTRVYVAAVEAGTRPSCWLKGLFSYTFKPTMHGLAVRVRNDKTGASLLARPEGYPENFPDPI